MKNRLLPFLLIIFILILNSCFGLSADIQMRKDGSGKILLEYRISRMAEIIGRLDGNEKWPVIPAGRADFERTVARIPGIKLASFSSREEPGKDIVNRVTLEYKNTEALLSFFDPSHRRTSFSKENGGNRLHMILYDGVSPQINSDLLELMKEVSAGYKLKISFSAEGNSKITFSDETGRTIEPPAGAETVLSGKKVSLSTGIGEILSRKQGLGITFSW
ncbi:MAG: hypothetical protein LBH44_04425 [Treponema sp.]|jgi:hypothetical protein|nr:hypothetical protein [Treponema sp.]